MAILDIYNKNSEENQQLQDNPQAMGVMASIMNGMSPNDPSLYAQQEAPQQAPVQPQVQQQEQPQQPQVLAQGQQEPSFWDTVKQYAGKVGEGLATATTNPGLMDSLRAFGASMANDKAGFEAAENSYTQRLDQNQQMKARQQQEQNAIKIKQQQEYTANLYKQYTPESVQAYLGTGNPAALVENADTIKTRNDNERADKSLDLQTATATHNMQNQDDNTALAHQKYLQDLQKYEDDRGDKDSAKSITLDTGDVVTTPGIYKTKDGSSVKVTSNGGKLSSEPLTGKDAPVSQESGAISQAKADMNYVQDALQNRPETVSKITGQAAGRSEAFRDLLSSSSSQDVRDLYQAAKRVDASFQNMGIAEAKAAGASGINTLAEVQQFTRGMPQYDYTSPTAFAASQQKKAEYMDRWNSAHPNKDSNAPTQSTAPASIGGGWTVTKH